MSLKIENSAFTIEREPLEVEELNLAGKKLTLVPQEIRRFSRLRSLDLSGNRLKGLPIELFELKDLQVFKAKGNLLASLPDEIVQWKALKELQLSSNELTKLPDLGSCSSLEFVHLDHNRLTELPRGFGQLKRLFGLYLHGNALCSLPDDLFQAKGLQALCASSNALESLPPSISRASKLRALWLSHNRLKELPAALGVLPSLTYLSVQGNPLAELPEEMGALDLQHFSFDRTHIPTALYRWPFWSLDLSLYPRPEHALLNAAQTQKEFEQIYWKRGVDKWKEAIDGIHHALGPLVYDEGLHDPQRKEPGYHHSMQKAFEFLSENGNRIVDADFYLATHRIACGHFKGEETATIIDQKKIGVFRSREDAIQYVMPKEYTWDPKAAEELKSLNMALRVLFGASFSLGFFKMEKGIPCLKYHAMTADQVRVLFDYFLTEFYYEIGHAESKEQKVTALARWFQRIEWLHPTVDGSGRTNLAILNYLLSCYGLGPVALDLPYVSNFQSLEKWVKALNSLIP